MVVWLFAVVAVLAVVVWLVRRRRIRRLRAAIVAREEELRWLVSDRLPAAVQAAQGAAVVVPGLAHRELDGTEFAELLDVMLQRLGAADEQARQRASVAASATVRGVTSEILSTLKRVELLLHDVEHQRPNPEVLKGVWAAGQKVAKARHGVQALQVVCGGWPGQQRRAARLSDVVRGAASRLEDGDRVVMHQRVNELVSGRLVEPLAMVFVELLRNALDCSPSASPVEVYFQSVHHGWQILVDDKGPGLHEDQRRRAERVLSGARPVDLMTVGDPPRLGFAVIAALLHRAESGVHVEVGLTSSAKGMRASIVVPHSAFTTAPTPQPASPPASAPVERTPAPPAGEITPTTTQHGLPRRSRRDPTAPSVPPKVPAAPAAEQQRNAAALGAFQRGIQAATVNTDEGAR
ncbi:hypothetical protein MOQ72_36305 [Saccharopolyspora sp. K220]|uniref:ATP-binding protein n=1 Tax=Saccharopolyspora soli TaxID=2926618 RepID=UPI001F59C515|nr:sensor histidine kinase [Saccharopolyspora soli]MCI2422902.1 hypothetical protein [Saccharopolyspora soli]